MQEQMTLQRTSIRREVPKNYAKKQKESRQIQRLCFRIKSTGRTDETPISNVLTLTLKSKTFATRKTFP